VAPQKLACVPARTRCQGTAIRPSDGHEQLTRTELLQAKVDSGVTCDAAGHVLLPTEPRLMLSVVIGDKGVDLSKAAGLVAVSERRDFVVRARRSVEDWGEATTKALLRPEPVDCAGRWRRA
jgi:hypothetical protein